MAFPETYVLVIGVGSDKYSATELKLLPVSKINDSNLFDELNNLKGHQWRDVYRDPCRCHKSKCSECEDWKKIKHEKGQKESRAAWILFNKIAIDFDPTKMQLPGHVTRIFSFNQ